MRPLPFPVLVSVCALAAFGGFSATRQLISSLAASPQSTSSPAESSGAVTAVLFSSEEQSEAIPRANSLAETRRHAENAPSAADAKRTLLRAIQTLNAKELESLLIQDFQTRVLWELEAPEVQLALQRFAQLEPERAAKLWAETRFLTHTESKLHTLFLIPWLKKEPDAFFQWFSALDPSLSRRARTFLQNTAKEQPELLFTHAAQLDKLSFAPRLMVEAVDKLCPTENGPPEAWEKVLLQARALPEGRLRDVALAWIAQKNAKRKDSDFPILRESDVQKALAAVPWEFAMPGAPDGILDHLPAGPLREWAVQNHMMRETKTSGVSAALEKLESLRGTADYGAATLAFVEFCAGNDPGSLALAAARVLSLPAESPLRARALGVAAAALYKADPEAARAWVREAPLSPQEYFQLTGESKIR